MLPGHWCSFFILNMGQVLMARARARLSYTMGAQAKGGALISIGAQMVTVFEAFKEGIPLLLAVDIHPTPENVEELMG